MVGFRGVGEGGELRLSLYFLAKLFSIELISPGAPPAPVRLSGQKIFEEKFSPFQWTVKNKKLKKTMMFNMNGFSDSRIALNDSKDQNVSDISNNQIYSSKNMNPIYDQSR